MDLYQVLPEEEEAVTTYALEHPREGYRRLAWMMIDEDIVYLSPSTVYRILDRRDLLCRWKPPSAAGQKPVPPSRPHQQWHTDLMYLWVSGQWYFFIAVLDSYSRWIVDWDLLSTMTARDVTDVVHRALEKHPNERPRIVHDNGTQFTGKDFRSLIKRFALEEIRIRIQHPESNGRIERFHRSLCQEGLSHQELRNQLQAQDIIAEWIEFYNTKRLHAALGYLTPQDWLEGKEEERFEERRMKLESARDKRFQENLKRQKQEKKCQGTLGGVAPEPPGFTALDEAGGAVQTAVS